LIGLEGYHDSLYWSWLMALAAKVSWSLRDVVPSAGDDAEALFGRLIGMAKRDRSIAEVFEPKPNLPRARAVGYWSEMPFSWGAAFVIDAVSSRLASPPSRGFAADR
jgi:hypothetical protein